MFNYRIATLLIRPFCGLRATVVCTRVSLLGNEDIPMWGRLGAPINQFCYRHARVRRLCSLGVCYCSNGKIIIIILWFWWLMVIRRTLKYNCLCIWNQMQFCSSSLSFWYLLFTRSMPKTYRFHHATVVSHDLHHSKYFYWFYLCNYFTIFTLLHRNSWPSKL